MGVIRSRRGQGQLVGRVWRGPISPPQPQGIMRTPELCHLPIRGAVSGLLRWAGDSPAIFRLVSEPKRQRQTKVQAFTECHGRGHLNNGSVSPLILGVGKGGRGGSDPPILRGGQGGAGAGAGPPVSQPCSSPSSIHLSRPWRFCSHCALSNRARVIFEGHEASPLVRAILGFPVATGITPRVLT